MNTSCHVLVVEDDQPSVRAYERFIRSKRAIPVAAGCLAAARRALEQHTFRLVLLDVLLPDGNGLDLIAHVRRSPSADARIVVVTGLADARVAERAHLLRAEFLLKPDELVVLEKPDGHWKLAALIANLSQAVADASDDATSRSRDLTRDAVRAAALTPSEAGILRLLTRGVPRPSLTKVLGVTTNTVNTHVRRVKEKLTAAGFVLVREVTVRRT
jgi:DNA-binding NarL/FixJ family response regulator